MNKILILTLPFLVAQAFAQKKTNSMIIRMTSAHTSFPDTGRAEGYHYDNVLYRTAEHYNDSSVMIIVPSQLDVKKKLNIVCWFHGWNNNIDSVPARYDLIKQFLASNRNAVLVLSETARDAPDSYGGKLEQKNSFRQLLLDVLGELNHRMIIGKNTEIGNVVLAGHSGAFRVMAYILQNGGVEVNEVILFDALYGQVDKYSDWILTNKSHRFINLYTNKSGGTDEVSVEMMGKLNELNVHYIKLEEREVNTSKLETNNIIFIHSLKEHDNVINRPDHNFQLFMENCLILN